LDNDEIDKSKSTVTSEAFTVDTPLDAAITLEHFISPDTKIPIRNFIFLGILVALHLWIIVSSACKYLEMTKFVFESLPKADHLQKEGIIGFITFSTVWFALTGLASSILSKVTSSIVAEIRLGVSRAYIAGILKSIIKVKGVDFKNLIDLASLGVLQDSKVESTTKLFAIQKNIESLYEAIKELLQRKEKS
jgi:hypothetical protein